jgi:addiction module HigA family antidote
MSGAFIVKSRWDNEVVHPGVILMQHYMLPADISQNELAFTMGVSPRRVNEIVHGKRAITADTAIRLQEVLGGTAHYWMYLQADYDLEITRHRGVRMQTAPRGSYRKRRDPDCCSFDEEDEEPGRWGTV